MYEGRNAQMFHPTTAVITWMSHPAQPSFVWQLYHYDLEPNSSLFAVKSAGELVHIQFNEANGELEVINNLPQPLTDAVAHVSVYLLDGSLATQYETKVTAEPSSATSLGPVKFPDLLTSTHFLKLELDDAQGKVISSNFYWRGEPGYPDAAHRSRQDAHRPHRVSGATPGRGRQARADAHAAQSDREHCTDGSSATAQRSTPASACCRSSTATTTFR